ncbi:RNA pseudouridine synthase 4, mitochondrial isoform X1 [Zea mays]|uniref:RNA pseudouridine synthase 4, mitochondrial isoform X1 n=1 Tax=Zea mays TaxID=4577 RepID=UPI0009A95152|nr:uncharacterized protein LOC100285271 isoform X1 [Zea mays]|eukprot:XP_020396157.1 uncharacterized protein LOC100285271 isoform X2 [Zea mays]
MAIRMPALIFRRRAAAAAPKPIQQYLAGLSTAVEHVIPEDNGHIAGGEENKKRWVELPPFAPLDANATARAISRGDGGEGACSNATAIRWVRHCCPHVPASLVQKLFRLRKVKKNLVTADTSSTDSITLQLRLRRVSAKDELVPGDILFLPVNIQESSVTEKTKKFGNKNEIDFLRDLEIYKDRAIIVLNKPPGMPVQGGVGIKNSIDILAPMFENGSSEVPRLVVLQDGRSERLTVCAGSNTASVQDALTEYRVIESFPQGYTWLELFPRTGRKHQLRVHCAEVLGTPIVGDYKYGRQAHQNWMPLPMPQTIDKEMLKKRKLPFGLTLGGGSVAEQQPQLHLHCKQMILPDISAAMQQLRSSDADHDFSDLEKLSFVAPLPLHMQLSWKILLSVGK